MRFQEKPRNLLKIKTAWKTRACKFVDLETFDISQAAAEKKIYELFNYFSKVPSGPYSLEQGMRLDDIGTAYGELLAVAAGWKSGEVVFREKNKSDDIYAIVSPNHEYVVFPIGLILFSHEEDKKNCMVELWEKICSGQLPPAKANEFFDLTSFFYRNKTVSKGFGPVEKDKQKLIDSTIRKALNFIDFVLDASGFVAAGHVENVIKAIEKDIEESQQDPECKPEAIYLAALGSLYGQCWVTGGGYHWATCWLAEAYQQPVVVSADENYWLRPTHLIRKALLSKTRPQLLTLYRQGKEGTLPPLESPPLSDEIEYPAKK